MTQVDKFCWEIRKWIISNMFSALSTSSEGMKKAACVHTYTSHVLSFNSPCWPMFPLKVIRGWVYHGISPAHFSLYLYPCQLFKSLLKGHLTQGARGDFSCLWTFMWSNPLILVFLPILCYHQSSNYSCLIHLHFVTIVGLWSQKPRWSPVL